MKVETEDAVIRKMGKNPKKIKRKDYVDVTGVASPSLKENSNAGEEVSQKKRDKRRKDGPESKSNGLYDGVVNAEGYTKLDADVEKEKGKKKKKKKHKKRNFESLVTHVAATSMELENNMHVDKGDNKKKKNKKREASGDILLDGTCDESVNRNAYVEVMSNDQNENYQKKRKRTVKSLQDKDSLNHGIHVDSVESGGLEINGGLDSGNKKRSKRSKDKKKKPEKGGENDKNILLSTQEILDSDDRDKGEVSRGKKISKKEGHTEMKKGGAKQKKIKKGKGDCKDSDGNGKNRIQEVGVAESKNCDGGVLEKVKIKKRKNKEANKNEVSPGLVENTSENPECVGKSKKVRFSSHVEVFPLSDDQITEKEKTQNDDLVRGKRFTKEEDKIVKAAVFNYIKAHCLGDEGLNMILHCASYPEIRNCWKEIGTCLPYRPYSAIYYRAHVLFERDEKRKWTAEEYDLLRKYQEGHGNEWKSLAEELGKHRFHVKDAWRRIKLPNMKKGHWSQDEYQTLFDLVNTDLQLKTTQEKKSKHGMLRDNICWSAISDKLGTRTNAVCCRKWYGQLTSPMVSEGTWADIDDYRLVYALLNLDACCIEDVNWDDLLDHRPGDICRNRWHQMVLHISHHGNKPFPEQVETLAKRYCPHLLEARETWDTKPVVP